MIKKSAAIFILLIALTLSINIVAQDAGQEPTVEEILERYIEAVGGRKKIEKLTTRMCIGKEITDLTTQQQPIFQGLYFEAYTRIPNFCVSATWSDSEIYRKGFNGFVGWIEDKCGVQEDEKAGRSALDWILNPQNALCIEEYFPGLKIDKKVPKEGVITLTPASHLGKHNNLRFDIKTGLIIGVGRWKLEDYREVDGVLFPFKIVTDRKGGFTAIEFERVEHNVEINDSLFVMPSGSK